MTGGFCACSVDLFSGGTFPPLYRIFPEAIMVIIIIIIIIPKVTRPHLSVGIITAFLGHKQNKDAHAMGVKVDDDYFRCFPGQT